MDGTELISSWLKRIELVTRPCAGVLGHVDPAEDAQRHREEQGQHEHVDRVPEDRPDAADLGVARCPEQERRVEDADGGQQEVGDDRDAGPSPRGWRSPTGRRSRCGRPAGRGLIASLRGARRGARSATNVNEMTRSTRPIVQSASFHGSTGDRVAHVQRDLAGQGRDRLGQRGGDDRAVADHHLDRQRLAGGPHHAQDHRRHEPGRRLPAAGRGGSSASAWCRARGTPVRSSRGTREERVVGDARDGRQDHEGQHERAGEPAEARR